MTKDSINGIEVNELDETEFDIDDTEIDFEEDMTEADARGLVECRRFVGERRQGQDPNYNGPSRRMNPDRRKSVQDRRQQDDEDSDE